MFHSQIHPPGAIWSARVLGTVMVLIGAVLLVGGIWLAILDGSRYYLVVGAALIACGILIFVQRSAGAWLYIATYIGTLLWALWEVGPNGWPLVPRVVAPTVLLLFVLAVMPVLDPAPFSWRTAWSSIAGLVIIAAVAGVAGGFTSSPTVERAVPTPSGGGMADPSPQKVGEDWPAYGGTYSAQRYSPLDQINASNVSNLQRVWTFHTGDLPQSDFAKGKYGAETTPLKVGDTLYLCTPKNILIALDPEKGTERWRYDPKVSDAWIPYTAACRGVAFYAWPNAAASDPCATRIVEGTLDSRLIAVDAKTGQPCAGFGTGGEADTKAGMGEVVPGMLSITSAPTIVRGVIVVGHQVLDGQTIDAPSGAIQGYDAVTGKVKWVWDMGNPDLTGLPPEGQTYTRGTPNMWTTATGDENLGLVYLPLGNAAVDYLSSHRTDAENRYSSSLVALDVTTGKPAWHFQTVRKDVWDYDLGSQATLVDFPSADGGVVAALVLPSKQGDFYVLDRRTGQPLTGVEERSVPQGGVEPEQRSKTQPFSLYHDVRKPELNEVKTWGMSAIDQMICRILFRKATYEGIYTPPTSATHWLEYPSYNGGVDWGGIAVDPRRGVIVANYNDMPNHDRLVPRDEADRLGWAPPGQERGRIGGPEGAGDPQMGAPFAVYVNAGWRLAVTKLLCSQPPYGGIRVIDLKTGKTLWDQPLGEARANGPFDIPSMLPITIGTPNNGGSVVTAGGLIFIAAATDNLMRAIDIETGQTVWSDVLPGGGQATPMTYQMGNKQYLVIMAGGHHFMETPISDALVAYALPE
jgi:quinoprotein glucose dehydrogenase